MSQLPLQSVLLHHPFHTFLCIRLYLFLQPLLMWCLSVFVLHLLLLSPQFSPCVKSGKISDACNGLRPPSTSLLTLGTSSQKQTPQEQLFTLSLGCLACFPPTRWPCGKPGRPHVVHGKGVHVQFCKVTWSEGRAGESGRVKHGLRAPLLRGK